MVEHTLHMLYVWQEGKRHVHTIDAETGSQRGTLQSPAIPSAHRSILLEVVKPEGASTAVPSQGGDWSYLIISGHFGGIFVL